MRTTAFDDHTEQYNQNDPILQDLTEILSACELYQAPMGFGLNWLMDRFDLTTKDRR